MTESLQDIKNEILTLLPDLRAFARSLARDATRADDLVQDTIVKAWSNFDKFQPGTDLRAWLFTILRNHYYSELRKIKREVEDPNGVIAGAVPVAARQLDHVALADFNAALATLGDEQREALVLVGASGFSYEEAAAICGCAIGTVKSRVNRARARLAEVLALGGEHKIATEGEASAARGH